jgi:MFS transporter, ACS family, hexuronate transporter
MIKFPDNSRAWAICGLLLLATMLNYMDRQALAVTLPTLKVEHHLAEGRVGMLEAWFGFSFAFGSLFFGWLADRWGPRYLYPLVLGGWSLAGIATSYAGQTWLISLFESAGDADGTGEFRWLLICRMFLGVCEAGHWPCALLTIRAILSAEDRTLGNGILQSGASIGAILVPLYIQATDRAGQSWEFPFWTIGLAGFLWVPLWFALVGRTNLSQTISHAPEVQHPNLLSASESDPSTVTRRLIVLAIIISTLTISWQFLRAWLGLFLQDHHGYTKEATRGLMSGYFISADVGCILSGVLVTRLTTRGWQLHSARQFGFFVFTLLTACAALAPFVSSAWIMIALLFTAAAGILGLHPYYYSLAQEISAKRMGLLSGLLAACGWIVASLSQMYLGRHIEATKSYQLGLVIVGLAPLIGFIALSLLWPVKKEVVEQTEGTTS